MKLLLYNCCFFMLIMSFFSCTKDSNKRDGEWSNIIKLSSKTAVFKAAGVEQKIKAVLPSLKIDFVTPKCPNSLQRV